MSTIQSGKRHEIEFYEPPDANTFLAGVAEVLRGPSANWGTAGICFRCLSISPDKRTYIVEEVDIWQTLPKNPVLSKYTKVVEILLWCGTCSTKYKVWQIAGDDWNNYNLIHMKHCPACPPMTADIWLAQLGYYQERPSTISVEDHCIATGKIRPQHSKTEPQPQQELTINMADFD